MVKFAVTEVTEAIEIPRETEDSSDKSPTARSLECYQCLNKEGTDRTRSEVAA